MAILSRGQTFASGDQVTAQKLQDIVDLATFDDPADESTIVKDTGTGKLKVPSNGIGSNELASDPLDDNNRAVGTDHIKDNSVTAAKLDSAAVSVLMPTGTVLSYAASTAPTGYLVCAGQSVTVADYGDLHGVIGYTYGGSGASFNLPDLRGRVIAGLDNMGGTAAGNLTGRTTLGDPFGAETHTLLVDEMPSHSHGYGYSTEVDSNSGGDTHLSTSADNSLKTTSATGGGAAHNNVQPTMTLNYIIKT